LAKAGCHVRVREPVVLVDSRKPQFVPALKLPEAAFLLAPELPEMMLEPGRKKDRKQGAAYRDERDG